MFYYIGEPRRLQVDNGAFSRFSAGIYKIKVSNENVAMPRIRMCMTEQRWLRPSNTHLFTFREQLSK